jgi:hypothetical protein
MDIFFKGLNILISTFGVCAFLQAEIDFELCYYILKELDHKVIPNKKFDKNGHTVSRNKSGTRQVLYSSEVPTVLQ